MMMQNSIFKPCLMLLMASCLQFAYAQEPEDSPADKFQLLTNTATLPSVDGQLLTIPNMGLFYTSEGNLYSLDAEKSPVLQQFRFKDSFSFDQLIVSSGTFLAKSQQFVLQIDQDHTKLVMELDSDCFDIYGGRDNAFHLVVQEDSAVWAWYECDMDAMQLKSIVRTEEPISLIVEGNAARFCIVGHRIYMETDTGFTLLTETEEQPLDIVLTTAGILFCTESTLYLIDYELQSNVFATGRFHSLYYDDGTLYVVLQNGDILKTEM